MVTSRALPRMLCSMSGMDATFIRAVDAVAARAVPAAEVQDIDGWLARCTPGLATKRVNSVWPREHDPEHATAAKLAKVEGFYSERGLPARYQISPASQPAGLEQVLLRRGYAMGTPTGVLRCDLAAIAAEGPAPLVTVKIDPTPSSAWWATWQAALGVGSARRAAVAALFDRVPGERAYVTVAIDRAVASVAVGVLDGGWLGVFNMATLPGQRRRGAGRTALTALATWARGRAEVGYLQVELDNAPALGLYRTVGFELAYRYVYLTA